MSDSCRLMMLITGTKISEHHFPHLLLDSTLAWGPFIYYVSTCKGEGGLVRKWQFLPISSTETMLRRGGPKSLKMCLRNI